MPLSPQVTKRTLSTLTFVSWCLRGKNQITLIVSFLLSSTNVISQQKKIASIEIADVHSAYVDRPGDLYVLQKNNTLKKFDIQGKLVSERAFPEFPATFDPRDGARMFVCFQSTQHCSFFSEETKQEFVIEPQYAIDPQFICSSGDHHIWILDRSDWSLKMINPAQSKVMTEAFIDQTQFTYTPEFTFIREYQNFLFMIEKNSGILIFNCLGKQVKKIGAAEIEYLNFLGAELYYKKNDKLFFYDLFDASTREIPVDPACRFALLTDARMFLIYENKIVIFENY